jgi:hypothetical protein
MVPSPASPRLRLAALRLLTLLLGLLVVPAAADAQNLVADGGFENPVGCTYYGAGSMGAWSVVIEAAAIGTYDMGCFSGANVTEGNQACDLGMAGSGSQNSISQQLPTLAGETYTLTFDWGSEYDWGIVGQVTAGDLDETLIDAPATPPCDRMVCGSPWIQHSASFDFVANGDDVLTFTDVTSAGNSPGPVSTSAGLALDNVVVVLAGSTVSVAEPPLVVRPWAVIKSAYR